MSDVTRHHVTCQLRQGIGTHCTCGVGMNGYERDCVTIDVLERILAELQSWTPILAALNWQVRGVPVNGAPVQPGESDGRD